MTRYFSPHIPWLTLCIPVEWISEQLVVTANISAGMYVLAFLHSCHSTTTNITTLNFALRNHSQNVNTPNYFNRGARTNEKIQSHFQNCFTHSVHCIWIELWNKNDVGTSIFLPKSHQNAHTNVWRNTIMAVLPPTVLCIHYVALLGFCSMHAGSSKRPATPKPNRLARSRWPTFLYTTERKREGTHTTGLKNVDPRRKYYYPT